MLKEGIGDHRHEGMTIQALPGSSLEVIEPQFLFQLLVRLLANPSCLDRGGQGAQVRVGRQIAQIVLLLAAGAVLADEPGFVARQMLLAFIVDTLGRAIGGAHPHGGEARFQSTLGPMAPTDRPPPGLGQHLFGRRRQDVWNGVLPRTAATGNEKDKLRIDRIGLLMTGDSDRPGKTASREGLAEGSAQPIAGIGQHTAKAHTSRNHPIKFRQCDLRFGSDRTVLRRNSRARRPFSKPQVLTGERGAGRLDGQQQDPFSKRRQHKAVSLVEAHGIVIDGVCHNRASAGNIGGCAATPYGIGQQIGAEVMALDRDVQRQTANQQ